ncbi:sensor histidine kinase [Cypionkella aquatica]|uniref:Sensory/regulatory protein RpfC n=1 Tax=Cypionkella aquatica TaxID=1756042 RepID=A0AA37X0Q7_9RHOB|nr:response regulator [Cypionkella aquatica]GLS86000.1 sensor histidine kinase [Cypionkella aquatica]
MEFAERLAKERRARLAAERLLEQKSRELFAANAKLGLHARALSDQIVEQRQVVKSALTEAEQLKGQQSRFVEDLDRAHTVAVMAERRLWDSINTIKDGFAVFDSGLQLVAANSAYLSAFKDPQIVPGLPYVDLLCIAAEGGRIELGGSTPDVWVADMLARWDTEVIDPITIKFKNGTWIRLVDQRARDGDMVSLALDITEQMRIWAAIEAVPDGFVLFDREERLLTCNQNYRDIYPVSAAAMIPGAKFEDILRYGLSHGQHRDAIGQEDQWLADRLAQHRNPGLPVEQQLSDGRWIRAQDHATPDGGRVGLRVDITHLKEQQVALEAARVAAEAASRAKSAFLANMSHEIRTPMNGVVGMAELLCDTALSEEQRLFAETIRSSGEALLVIINDILDFSKIEAERLTLHPEPFDMERTIHEITMLLQPRAREKGLDLMIDFDMFLPTRYIGDPGRLRQILTNLIGNAVKFTDKGHVLIRVVGLDGEDGRQDLHVTVEDTGIGISAENLAHIFGEFNQVESQSNRKFEGTGLGLAITKRLVERMEGEVWVDSELGKGACFGFRIPLPIAEDAEQPRLPINVKRVLVVDDQFINRTILERQLVPCGIEVRLCRSGAEALLALGESSFDAIITDHEMPEMDGLILASHIRAKGIETPILLLSSSVANAREGEGAQHLAATLQKPILRADLYRRLQSLAVQAVEPALAVEILPEGALRQMRVLAAEDNRTNQLVFQKMVRHIDIDLVFANNGVEAVALFQSFKPDLIFMDISMPQMDGRDAAKAIRALEAGKTHVPIVALTAHALDGDSEGILAAGIDRYMTKPLRKAEITQTLAGFCPVFARPILADEQAA